jgi:HEAT repeat protein
MANSELRETFSPDDALPPVEPPSAGFLVQLFLIPGIIVAIIVMVWMMFQWLAHMGSDPRKHVDALQGHGESRWQAAVNLAGALNDKEGDALRNDPEAARKLGLVLQEELKSGSKEERLVNLRIFLCAALGRFKNDAGLPALLEAVNTKRNPTDDGVRIAALKGIGDMAENVNSAGGKLDSTELVPTLLKASQDERPEIRAAAGLALGAVGGSEAHERLLQMLNDESSTVRYDAAMAIAKDGDLKSLETLIEMLDEDQSAALRDVQDKVEVARLTKVIHVKGLQGIDALISKHPTADFQSVKSAVDALTKSESPEVKEKALRVQKNLPSSSQ